MIRPARKVSERHARLLSSNAAWLGRILPLWLGWGVISLGGVILVILTGIDHTEIDLVFAITFLSAIVRSR